MKATPQYKVLIILVFEKRYFSHLEALAQNQIDEEFPKATILKQKMSYLRYFLLKQKLTYE